MASGRELDDAAHAMVAAADNHAAIAPILRRHCPTISRQITADARRPSMFSLWGRSLNFDENAEQTIVDPAIVATIGELAGKPMHGEVVHAGLLHTYGYLFSLIETPYGAKRDRWVLRNLEAGFGIDRSLLSDEPRDGTLLANATWFFASIALRGSRARESLEAKVPHAARELKTYDFAKLQIRRIVEEGAVSKARVVRLFTDLVKYPNSPKAPRGENTLLIYSLQSRVGGPRRLITGFPMRPAAVEELCESVPIRGMTTIRLRYNAYLPGLRNRLLRGRRYFAVD